VSHDLSGLLCLNRRGLLAIAVSLNMISGSVRRAVFRAGWCRPQLGLTRWQAPGLPPQAWFAMVPQFAMGYCLAPVHSALSCRDSRGESW